MIGETISHYKIVEKLGEGGMGEVYKAEDTRLKRILALKFLPARLTDDPEARIRFVQEAQAASALDHSNICTIYDIKETDAGQTYIVMACYEGGGLDDLLKRGPLPFDKALETAIQVAGGLSRAHEEGIVHRDIKPANIIFTERGEAKIVDFGIAKLAGGTKLTRTGSTLGTFAYMSPEQARGDEVDHRSDIWSLGVVLFEMVTGKLPFEAEYQAALLYSIINDEPKPAGEVLEDIPAELEAAIVRALEKNPEKRYQSAEEMLCDLKVVKKTITKETAAVTAGNGRKKRLNKAVLFASIAAVLVVIFSLFILFLWPRGELEPSETDEAEPAETTQLPISEEEAETVEIERQRPSIAVLAFENMSPDPDQDFFCDGISEEIINRLANVEGLKVIARSSSFQFKGERIDVSEIGRQLNVSTVLEGSVRKSGNSLRIVAQLIDVSDNSHMWSDSFDRELKDIFSVQDEISLAIVDVLKVKLLGAERARLLKRSTDDVEAHNLYLRGLHYWNQRTGQGLLTAIDYFQRAIDRDPNYALAYVGLADCYNLLDIYHDSPAYETSSKAKAAAIRALEIDGTLAEAHTSLAYAISRFDWDLAAAESEFKSALELNPNYATGHFWYGEILTIVGRNDESIAAMKRALELDPISQIINTMLGWAYWNAGHDNLAISHLQKTIELNPDFSAAYHILGYIYYQLGQYEKAIQPIEKAVELSARNGRLLSALAAAYAKAGRYEDAIVILEELEARSERQYVSPFFFAQIYEALGETDTAFELLEKAYEERHEFMIFLKTRDFFDELRSDPRYDELLKRIGLEQ